MKILTKFHGKQEIIKEEIIHFEGGIPGFQEEKEFYLFYLSDSPFLVLQSINSIDVAFIIMDPFQLFRDYEFDLSDEVLEALEITSKKDVAIFVILTVQEEFGKTTANLLAPIIINQKKRIAKQFILSKSPYTTKHSIIQPSVRSEQEVK